MNAGPLTQTSARKPQIHEDFDRVSKGYDRMCAMNPGYRKHLGLSAQRLQAKPGARLLDLCCGTGLSTAAILVEHPDASVQGLDASKGMLERARSKPGLAGVEFLHGDAMDPAAAGAKGPFDGILMAYGLRNVEDPDLCLERLFGLLAPGGTLCLHEYSVADSRSARARWNMVTCGIVIPLAVPVCRTTEIFRYLRRSVLEFDGVQGIESRLTKAGFEGVKTLPMDGWATGILHTFVGQRPKETPGR